MQNQVVWSFQLLFPFRESLLFSETPLVPQAATSAAALAPPASSARARTAEAGARPIVLERGKKVEERKKDVELQIIQEEMKRPMLAREDIVYWICRFRTLDISKLEERRRLIDSFVNSVTIFDDYILITFNYKEGQTRVSFKDIESSDLSSVGGPCGVSLKDLKVF